MDKAAFHYEAAPHQVHFGAGISNIVGAELGRLGASRPFLVSTRGQMPRARDYLGALDFAGAFDGAAMHTPVEVSGLAERAFHDADADLIISFGGGSATGLGKALAARSGRPLIAIGTTYGGSEMTSLIGETEAGVKRTRRDARVLPAATIYDVELTLALPPAMSAASGLNAIAHAVEAIYAPDANPVVSAIALEAIASLNEALRLIHANPVDREGRTLALRGACMAGLCLNAVSMGLHHKLCHTLGGAFDLPHAETHAVVLPYAMAFNRPAVGSAFAKIGERLRGDAVDTIFELTRDVAPFGSLRALGMPETGIARAVELVLSNPYDNPRPIDESGIRLLIERAWAGLAPEGY